MNCDWLLLVLQKKRFKSFFPAPRWGLNLYLYSFPGVETPGWIPVPRWGFFILLYDISLILSGKSDKITFSKSNFLPLKYGENTCFLRNYGIAVIKNQKKLFFFLEKFFFTNYIDCIMKTVELIQYAFFFFSFFLFRRSFRFDRGSCV